MANDDNGDDYDRDLSSLVFFLQVLKDALSNLFKDGIENPFYRPVGTFVLNPKVRLGLHCRSAILLAFFEEDCEYKPLGGP